jgi:hypothetical protein
MAGLDSGAGKLQPVRQSLRIRKTKQQAAFFLGNIEASGKEGLIAWQDSAEVLHYVNTCFMVFVFIYYDNHQL